MCSLFFALAANRPESHIKNITAQGVVTAALTEALDIMEEVCMEEVEGEGGAEEDVVGVRAGADGRGLTVGAGHITMIGGTNQFIT